MTNKKQMILSNSALRENSLIKNVYLWMSLGLVITGVVAFAVSQNMTLLKLFNTNPFMLFAILIAQFAIVMVLSGRLQQLRSSTAMGLFIAYSVVNGISLSSLFIIYTGVVLTQAFLTTAAMFLGATLFASVTKKNIASWGGYLTMGLWGLLVAMLINMFFPNSSTFTLMVSIIGVVLFMGLTVYDTARIKSINSTYGREMNNEEFVKIGIIGALNLYLDFLNIFLYVLRILGIKNRD